MKGDLLLLLQLQLLLRLIQKAAFVDHFYSKYSTQPVNESILYSKRDAICFMMLGVVLSCCSDAIILIPMFKQL